MAPDPPHVHVTVRIPHFLQWLENGLKNGSFGIITSPTENKTSGRLVQDRMRHGDAIGWWFGRIRHWGYPFRTFLQESVMGKQTASVVIAAPIHAPGAP